MPLPPTRSLDPTGNGCARWVMRSKLALNAAAIHFRRTTGKNHFLMKPPAPTNPFAGQSRLIGMTSRKGTNELFRCQPGRLSIVGGGVGVFNGLAWMLSAGR